MLEGVQRESFKTIRERLRAPVNGHHSDELEIVTEPELRRRRIQVIREAETARRDAARHEIFERSLEKFAPKQPAPITLSTDPDRLALPKIPSINLIIATVSDYYGISLVEMISQRREAKLVRARHIACYMAKILTNRSFPEIGRRMGGRDHTTILYAIRKVEEALAEQPGLQAEIDQIRERLGA